MPRDYSYREYAQIRSMKPVSALGAATTLHIEQTPNVPAPASGDTYASGCPPVSGLSASLTLVAR